MKEREDSISILEKVVKDYETMESQKGKYNNYDNYKVLNMLSMESQDYKRNVNLNDKYKMSGVKD